MKSVRFVRHFVSGLMAFAAMLAVTAPAHAVPAFARQTGQNCVACHVSFPELTPYGRYFKVSGYTLGERQTIPLAMMGQVEYTKIKDNVTDDGTGSIPVTGVNQVKFTGASLFLAGKATDNLGAFVQWTYDGIGHHSNIDNTDLRAVGRIEGPAAGEPDLIYGMTLNNNPSVQDIWNGTPAFGFPFTSSPVAYKPATPSALIDGGLAQKALGIGGYAFWHKSLYGELSFYRAATGPYGVLRAGQLDAATRLKGDWNPYWRFAYNREWDSHSLEVGTFGMKSKIYQNPTDPASGIGTFTDIGLDAQYQFITDPHVATGQLTYIHEKQSLDDTFVMNSGAANNNDTLKTFRAKGTYYFQRTYGATVAYAKTSGTADAGLYTTGFAPSNLPDSASWTFEFNYLPVQNVRLMLQYVDYVKFNGGTTNYSGTGRNAKDNNTLFLNIWVSY
jgi:hypothetical protein